MLRYLVSRLAWGCWRTFVVPALLAMAVAYFLLGAEAFHRLATFAGGAVARAERTWVGWSEGIRKGEFAKAQSRFNRLLGHREQVARQVDALRRHRDEVSRELEQETARLERAYRGFRPVENQRNGTEADTVAAELTLGRQRELRSEVVKTDLMLDQITKELDELDRNALDAWNAIYQRSLDLSRQHAWISGQSALSDAHGLLEQLPDGSAHQSGPLD